jgi:hypothetical protein
VIRAFDDVQVVFYNHYRIAHVNQPQEYIQQFVDVR